MKTWQIEDGQPPRIRPLIGLVARRIWIMPTSGTLAVELVKQDGSLAFLMIKAIPAPPGQAAALLIEVSDVKPGAKFDELTEAFPPPAELRRLFGQKFKGLDGAIVNFGNVGIMVEIGNTAIVHRRSFN
jgi:hypothetical protein